MELATYADRAVRLVNTADPSRGRDQLVTVEHMRALLASVGTSGRATHADVAELRSLRDRLREIFDAVDRGDQPRAVAILNELLQQYPVRPQVASHDACDWHLHIADGARGTAAAYAAKACFGLAVQATEIGIGRLGVCEASPCRDVFIDTSTNHSRRYCSDRCATRANVAAYRARKRAQSRAAVSA